MNQTAAKTQMNTIYLAKHINPSVVPEGFKKTEMGIIPKDWEVKRLGDIANIHDGTHQTPKYVPYGIPFYSVEHVTSGNFLNTKHISIEEHQFLTRSHKIEKDDVLMTRIGSIGECALVDWEAEASYYVSLALLKVNGALPHYIAAYSEHPAFKRQVEIHSLPSATPKKINLGPISNILVALPLNVEEQRAIATALKDVDTLLKDIDELIAKKQNLKQGAMQELLTGKNRLPGFKGEWEVKKLGELANIKTGSRNNADKKEDGAYPFFVRSQSVEHIDSYSYDCEAILVPGEGNIGNIFHYVNGKFDVHQRVYAITDFKRNVSAKFIYAYMSHYFGDWALQNTVKATVDSLRLPTFQTFKLKLPATKEEQDEISLILQNIDTEIETLQQRRVKTAALKQAMMQELLTGLTRLV